MYPKISYRVISLAITFTLTLSFSTSMSLADREGGSTQEEPGIAPGDSLPKLSTGSASRTEWRGATVEINEIKRSSTGSYASLTWTLINESDSTINLGEMRNRTYYYKGSHDGSGVVLIDEENSLRHNPFIDSQGKCLCAGSEHAPLKFELLTEPGESTTYWASYQLSEDTETVTVEIPGFLPIKDVPVG